MATTLATLNALINDRRRDTSDDVISMSTIGYRAINNVLELMQQLHDWEFTIKQETITYHKGIDWYAAPSDFKAPIDLRNQRTPRDREFTLLHPNDFDNQTLTTYKWAIDTKYNSSDAGATQYLRIKGAGDNAQIHTCTSYNGNGTWAVSGSATTLSTDSYEYYDLNASIKFTMAGTTGTITVDDMNGVDLARFKDRSKQYLNVYLPTVTNFRSVQLKIGSDSSNYYTDTETTDLLSYTPVIGWNTFEFDVWDTTTGTPDDNNLDYISFIVAYRGSTSNAGFRFENLFIADDYPLYLYYYSTDMVYDVGNAETTLTFPDATATTDYPLWSGKWGYVTESFVNAVLEEIFWITGETEDREKARQRQIEILTNLQKRLPKKTRATQFKISLGDDEV